MQLAEIQAALRDAGLDGWLFFDHHERDPLAYRILALNTEKAHNLRDRALEVIRMARSLAKRAPHAAETPPIAE